MSQFNLSATDIFAAIADNANLIKICADLHTLEENNGLNTIHVDATIKTPKFAVTFTTIAQLYTDGTGLICEYIDQNTENTYILISCEQDIIFDGEQYNAMELAGSHAFQELLLGSRLSNLSANSVNNILTNLNLTASTNLAA